MPSPDVDAGAPAIVAGIRAARLQRRRREPAQPDPGRRLDADPSSSRDRAEHVGRRAVERRCVRRRGPRSAGRGRRAGPSCARRSGAAVAGRASSRSASPTSRVPSGSSWAVGSSRTRCRGRIASSDAITTSCAWPPDRRRGSRSASRSMPSSASACARPLDASRRRGRPRFIGPRATSSKTVAVDARTAGSPGSGSRCRPVVGELVQRSAGHRLAVDRQTARSELAADRRRRKPGRDEAERRLARLVRPRRARRSRRRRGSGRCRGGRAWRSPRSDSRRLRSRASRRLRAARRRGHDDDPTRSGEQRPAQDRAAPGVSGIDQSRCRRPGRLNARDLERQAALLDVGQRREDDRADDRQEAAQPGRGCCPRCRARGPAGSPR